MVTVKDVYEAINSFAPFGTAETFDNPGILVDCENETGRVLFSLDVTPETLEEAVRRGCGIIVSHHPVMFGGVRFLSRDDPAAVAVKNGISVIAAHTNYDKAPGGINDVLCDMLALGTVSAFADGLGRIGLLKEGMSPARFAAYVKKALSVGAVAAVLGEREIRVVAVGGGASDFVAPAAEAGADALVTGEMKYHHGIDARRRGLTAVAAGHFATENPGMRAMRDYMERVLERRAECLYAESWNDPFQVI